MDFPPRAGAGRREQGGGRAGELRPGRGDSARENRASPRPASARQERWGGAARRHPGHRTPPCQAPTAARRGGREGAGGPARRGRPRSTPPPAAALRLPLPWLPPPAGLPVVVAQVHEGPDVSLRATARSPCPCALRATARSPRRRLASSSCPPRERAASLRGPARRSSSCGPASRDRSGREPTQRRAAHARAACPKLTRPRKSKTTCACAGRAATAGTRARAQPRGGVQDSARRSWPAARRSGPWPAAARRSGLKPENVLLRGDGELQGLRGSSSCGTSSGGSSSATRAAAWAPPRSSATRSSRAWTGR